MAGLVGSGRTEIRTSSVAPGNGICCAVVSCLNEKPIRYRVPRQAVRDGIVYITEDRKLDGFFETMTAD